MQSEMLEIVQTEGSGKEGAIKALDKGTNSK
jgi:hypothetical protein